MEGGVTDDVAGNASHIHDHAGSATAHAAHIRPSYPDLHNLIFIWVIPGVFVWYWADWHHSFEEGVC